jgi:YegS/Rv2252/BmrU family lipid kinase
MSKVKIILNPTARSYRRETEFQLRQFLSKEGFQFDLVKTTGAGQARVLAKEAIDDGFDVIVAAGGNGTCNEVINSLMDALVKGMVVTFGIIPIGSGNEFAKAVGIPFSLKEACHRLTQGQIKLIDVGRVSLPNGKTHFFGNTAGIGFDGKIALDLEKMRWLGSFPMFIWMTIKAVALYNRAPVMEIEFNGQRIIQPLLMVVVGNGQLEGTIFQVTPKAKIDDGVFDLLLVPEVNRLQILQFIPHFINGTHLGKKPINLVRTHQVRVNSEAELVVHIDGEILSTNAHQLEFEILPRQLRVLC